MSVLCYTCFQISKDHLEGKDFGMKCPDHENAINRSKLRTDSNEERAGGPGSTTRDGGVRVTVPVQCSNGHKYEQIACCSEDNPQFEPNAHIREESGVGTIPPEWMSEFGAACDTLCGRLGSLGGVHRAIGRGYIYNTLCRSGLCLHGPGCDVSVSRPVEEVGSTIFGCNPMITPDRCGFWPYCEKCGPPRL